MKRKEAKYKTKPELREAPTLLDCPQCHSFIASNHINEDKKIAKCDHCNHVFSYQTDQYWDPFGPPLETQPEGLEVLKLPSLLELRIKHREGTNRTNTFATLAFGLLWNIMLLPFLFFIVTSGQWYILLFISMHLFAGASMLWSVLGNLFNETTVEVNQHQMVQRTSPFAFGKQRERLIPISSIKQLSVTRSRSKKHQSGSNYTLNVLLISGKNIPLVSGLDKQTLEYVEQQVEGYLGIQDVL